MTVEHCKVEVAAGSLSLQRAVHAVNRHITTRSGKVGVKMYRHFNLKIDVEIVAAEHVHEAVPVPGDRLDRVAGLIHGDVELCKERFRAASPDVNCDILAIGACHCNAPLVRIDHEPPRGALQTGSD